eukprot:1194598-Prorocentrum_minimum.AAC.3
MDPKIAVSGLLGIACEAYPRAVVVYCAYGPYADLAEALKHDNYVTEHVLPHPSETSKRGKDCRVKATRPRTLQRHSSAASMTSRMRCASSGWPSATSNASLSHSSSPAAATGVDSTTCGSGLAGAELGCECACESNTGLTAVHEQLLLPRLALRSI